MKEGINQPVKKSIDRIREELHKIIEKENVSSKSSKLDELITLYYNTLAQQKRNGRV